MFRHLSDESFLQYVLKRGAIRFAVKGQVMWEEKVEFESEGIHLFPSPPNSDGYRYLGDIDVKESNLDGVKEALRILESWADMLCLSIGSAQITIEVLAEFNASIHVSTHLNTRSVERITKLKSRITELNNSEREKIARALWWYRKACVAREYSIFDAYSAYWNCLEILCNVSGNRINVGPEIDKELQKYLKSKNAITTGVINECYNTFVLNSIRRQMEASLKSIFQDEIQAEQWVKYCFGVSPTEVRLYQIRNDINHGNIRENSQDDYERVFQRGIILAELVRRIMIRKLGGSTSTENKDIDEYVRNKVSSGGSYDVFFLSG